MPRTRKRPEVTGFETEAETKAAKETGSELDSILADIQKKKGVGMIRRASAMPLFNTISTGTFIIDFALMGGIPEGLAYMPYGYESSGKTTHTMRIVAAMQRKYPDRTVVWLDPELTFDKGWAEKQGVDIEALYMVEPTSGEEAVDILSGLLDTLEVSMVVIDSIPAMIPMKVDEESAEQQFMALHARLIGRMCSKILLSWSKERKRDHRVTVVLTNQWRSKMVMMGDPRSLPGGYQLSHLVTTRVELKNKPEMGKDAFDTEIVEKNVHSFTVGKAKIGSSIRHGEFEMTVNPDHPLGPGVFTEAKTVCVYAKRFDLITGNGGAYRILDVGQKFRKLEDMEAFLYANDAEFLRLKQRIIAKQRVDKGLPALPPDGYLLDFNAKENLAGFID